jgi:glyoxylase-like metal-dependent hydrolase (beta-lactamase superfamily II)
MQGEKFELDARSSGGAQRAIGELNFHNNQLLMQAMITTVLSMLVIFLINPIGQIGQISSQQCALGQENANVSSSATSNEISANMTLPQIHNFTSTPPAPVNSWIMESRNGVVIIDTQRTLSEANNALDEIKKIGKPILGVIITHPHPDHIGGTAVLLNRTADVPIYSTQLTYDIMKNDTGGLIAFAKRLHGNDYTDQVVLPNRIVKSGENITIDGITYNFEDIGPGEGGDMMLIYLPEQKLLFTGDVVNNRMHPALIEGHSTEWITQIEYIGQNYPAAKVLFPGHGRSGSPKTLLDEQLNYINTFRSLVEQQMRMQSKIDVGGERAANITEEGKMKIKNELQRLYPDYLHVALMPLDTMFDLNIDAVTKEINQDRWR